MDFITALTKALTTELENSYEILSDYVPHHQKVKDDGNSYSFNVKIPGFEREEIGLEVVDNLLKINAKNAEETVNRAWYIPKDVDKDGVTASLKNGVLFVTLAKKAKPAPVAKKIRIE
jgi:HSP20 family protein